MERRGFFGAAFGTLVGLLGLGKARGVQIVFGRPLVLSPGIKLIRVLKAYGEPGISTDGKDWNWCNPDEVVGIHGSVCDSYKTCGCDRNFIGCETSKATTRAVVAEVGEREFAEIKSRLTATLGRAWPSEVFRKENEEKARFFDALRREKLSSYPVGTVLRVDKLEERLIIPAKV